MRIISEKDTGQINDQLFFDLKPENYHLIGLDEPYSFLHKQFTDLKDYKKKAEGGTYLLRGPIGSGKSILVNQLLKEFSSVLTIPVTLTRGEVVFESTDELCAKLDDAIKKSRRMKSLLGKISAKGVISVASKTLEMFDPTPGAIVSTIVTKGISMGAKGVVKVSAYRKDKLATITVATTDKHAEKKEEIVEKIFELSKVKPFVVLIENVQWIQMDDALVFANFLRSIDKKIPVKIIASFSEEAWYEGGFGGLSKPFSHLLENWLLEEGKTAIVLRNIDRDLMEKWLKYVFPNSKITDKFLTGFYDLTKGNLRYMINGLQYLSINDLIDKKESSNIEDWELPKEWSAKIPDNIMVLERKRLASLLEVKGVTPEIQAICKRVLEKAAVVGYPFKKFETDVLERVLPDREKEILPEILDTGIKSNLLNRKDFQIEFPSEFIHSYFYSDLGLAVKSELHYQIANQIEQMIIEQEFEPSRINAYYKELAIHYEKAINSYSELRSREAKEKTHQYYLFSALGMFAEGATEEALEMLCRGVIMEHLVYNPISYFELVSSELNELLKQQSINEEELEFLSEKFFPAYLTLLGILMISEIKEITKAESISIEDYEELIGLILEYKEGILFSLYNLPLLFVKIENVNNFLEKLNLVLSPIIFFLQYLKPNQEAFMYKARLDLIYNEFVSISELLIQGFELLDETINKAYFYNLLAHHSGEVGRDAKRYYSLCAKAYLDAAKVPIDDVVRQGRLVRNAGWNYLSSGELENAISAFQTTRSLLIDSLLDYDYIRLRIAELDLRSFQMILLFSRKDPSLITDQLTTEFRKYLLQFWASYGQDHEFSDYPQYLADQLSPYSEYFGEEFFKELKGLAKPIPKADSSELSRNILIVTNEFDYWLADIVHEKILAEDPRLKVTLADPEKFKKVMEEIKPDTMIFFGGPKAPHIGDLVVKVFRGESNFRYLTWRHEAGFGGVWSKESDGILCILIAGNDEETADGTLLFTKHKDKWKSGYHLSTLDDYFKHLQ